MPYWIRIGTEDRTEVEKRFLSKAKVKERAEAVINQKKRARVKESSI